MGSRKPVRGVCKRSRRPSDYRPKVLTGEARFCANQNSRLQARPSGAYIGGRRPLWSARACSRFLQPRRSSGMPAPSNRAQQQPCLIPRRPNTEPAGCHTKAFVRMAREAANKKIGPQKAQVLHRTALQKERVRFPLLKSYFLKRSSKALRASFGRAGLVAAGMLAA
jgi:hypothetical protein